MGRAASLHVVLIRPSNYDDDGYVVRYRRGVFPSNTLACMKSLTTSFAERWKNEHDIDLSVEIIDDFIEPIPFKRLHGMNNGDVRVVAALVGVQTNQFPRASEIALKLSERGIKTLIGGFHVSGVLAMFDKPTREIDTLTENGVTVVAGEAEPVWESIMLDVALNREKPLYRACPPPDITFSPVPQPDMHSMKHFAISSMGTIDCSRGCPFNCSFCTIINVQGRKMRYRSPETVLETIRQAYTHGIKQYFFTDDNFSRNPHWRDIFEGLIRLRKKEGMHVTFIMQVDTACDRIEGFVELASKAGCSNVFIGMESLNPANLEATGKTQNKVENYASFIEHWHRAQVLCHVGYIIGFPYDTPESVKLDIHRLKHEIKPDIASFFILTPLPGSRDHYELATSGAALDQDLNKYDSFHTVADHPLMSREELYQTYLGAWESFYEMENLENILLRARRYGFWKPAAFNIMWYKNSLLENRHPMVTGFVRWKRRKDVREGTPITGRFRFAMQRASDFCVALRQKAGLFMELQELWWLTRKPDEKTFRLLEELSAAFNEAKAALTKFDLSESRSRFKEEYAAVRESLAEKLNERIDTTALRGKAQKRLNRLLEDTTSQMESSPFSGYYTRSMQALSAFLASQRQLVEECTIKHVRQRRSISRFWALTWRRLKRGRVVSLMLSSPKIAVSAIRDLRMSIVFGYQFFYHQIRSRDQRAI